MYLLEELVLLHGLADSLQVVLAHYFIMCDDVAEHSIMNKEVECCSKQSDHITITSWCDVMRSCNAICRCHEVGCCKISILSSFHKLLFLLLE